MVRTSAHEGLSRAGVGDCSSGRFPDEAEYEGCATAGAVTQRARPFNELPDGRPIRDPAAFDRPGDQSPNRSFALLSSLVTKSVVLQRLNADTVPYVK